MKLAQIQIYACDRLVISAGPGRENSSHRHFGAILTIAPDAPVTLMSRDAEPVACQAAIVAPNAWHRIDARNARTVTVLVPGEEAVVLGMGDTLDGGVVLPGFTVAVDDIFAQLQV